MSCLVCLDPIPRDHTGLKCKGNHDYCSDCSKQFVEYKMQLLSHQFPPKCQQCKLDMHLERYMMNLTDSQKAEFLSIAYMHEDPNS